MLKEFFWGFRGFCGPFQAAGDAPDPAVRDNLVYLAQNLQRMHANVARVWSQG